MSKTKIVTAILISSIVATLTPGAAFALDLDLIFVAWGDYNGQDFGWSVQSPGDLNGDGYSEVFVAAKGSSTRAFNGGNPADSLPFKRWTGRLSSQAWIDDINGDGYRDFGLYNVVYGDAKWMDFYFGGPGFYDKTEPDFKIFADYQEGFFGTLQTEDYDGDGQTELILRASEPPWPIEARFYIYETYPELDSIADDTLTMIRDSIVIVYTGTYTGDINGDGFADYVTATYGNSTPSYILIFFGSAVLDSVPDLQIWSPFDESGIGTGAFGYKIVPVRDINQDGYDDFIVTHSVSPACIFYGGDPFDTIPKILQYPGKIANACGDINNDGWEDIAIGFTSFDFGSGKVFVYFGGSDMDTIADISIEYDEVFLPPWWEYPWHFGQSVGSAGDFNGDGVDDLIVGANTINQPDWNEGCIFILAGSDTLPTAADDVADPSLPERYNILEQNYPNPFNCETLIEYTLWGYAEREVEIAVYNILGQRVALLRDCTESGGSHSVIWDGKDDLGNGVPSGIYFYVLKSGDQTQTRKMLFLK
jgi:hypothetical protein